MFFQAVGEYCGVCLQALNVRWPNQEPLSAHELLHILQSDPLYFEVMRKGFGEPSLQMLRDLIGRSTYRRGARLEQAPQVFDCSSLTKWFYAQHGIYLPRRSVQQADMGKLISIVPHFKFGDLIFTKSRSGKNYYRSDPSYNIGHVSLATGRDIVLHASNKGIEETNVREIAGKEFELFRTARRIIPDPHDFYVLRTNPRWQVESSDDIFWLILQNLPQ